MLGDAAMTQSSRMSALCVGTLVVERERERGVGQDMRDSVSTTDMKCRRAGSHEGWMTRMEEYGCRVRLFPVPPILRYVAAHFCTRPRRPRRPRLLEAYARASALSCGALYAAGMPGADVGEGQGCGRICVRGLLRATSYARPTRSDICHTIASYSRCLHQIGGRARMGRATRVRECIGAGERGVGARGGDLDILFEVDGAVAPAVLLRRKDTLPAYLRLLSLVEP
ncbi:hypothetical protein B0H10DRAFT_901946 [Mycena sp. CBHHK59/15]|nr:hypothetical protein B0H10DRAFT_901946 [Mycena sp. CBHHK59/15]